jgi:heat shock protein HtpX
MISALRKISGHADLPNAPADVREMFIENHRASFADLFATHPPIEARIAALKAYAGGRDTEVARARAPGPWEAPRTQSGPWG